MVNKGESSTPQISKDPLEDPVTISTFNDASSAMSDHCTNNPPLDALESSSGEVIRVEGTDVYISKPADSENQGTSLLILLTNGVGVHSANNQVQADHFAKAGYFVVMPDLSVNPSFSGLTDYVKYLQRRNHRFNGDPAPNAANIATASEGGLGILDQIKMKAVEGAKGFMIDMWLARHTPENTMPIIENTLKYVKDKYGDKQYTVSLGTYAVGYCFGAKYALKLAANDEIVAAAIAHGVMISKEDFQSVKKPITLVCVENDPMFPDEIREEGRKFLEDNKLEHELRVYKGVPHGFAVHGSYPDQHINSSQKEAFIQFVQFLQRH